jgi:P-type Cu+ transporter
MHREISHAEQPFYQERNIALYLMTGLIGLLIAADLWPAAAAWLGVNEWAPWPREFYGTYRLALLAAVIGGARILYGSIESLLEGKLGADLALAIATIAAILIGEPLVAAEVVFIGMVGECLESFTFERTQRAIRSIVEVCPRRCWLLRNGEEVRVLTQEVQVGDRVVVKPGARIPVDGVVIEGRSAVDQSALTGESLPLEKEPGDEVLAGSLNQNGALTVEAKRVAEHTVVGRVIELTGKALQDKAPLERTADRLARLFLPAVLGLAALTFLVCMLIYAGPFSPAGKRLDFTAAVRMSVYPTLAVLVVSCPCALILATPAAIIAALGRLAGTGVLIKGGSALERLAQVKAIAFDKTGTLTEGRLQLGDVIGFRGVSRSELLRVAATAEQKSEHPLGKVILTAAAAEQLALEPLADFVAHPGAGVTARTVGTPGMTITVGTRRLLDEKKIAIPAPAITLLDKLDATGQTPLLIALEDVVIGVIGARDTVRPEAADVITELRNLGIEQITLLTGDRPCAARAIAEHVGIKEVHAELLPHQKAEIVGSGQQTAGREDLSAVETAIMPASASSPSSLPTAHCPLPTAFVGDGINDAPALARATVGLAIGGTGTDVAAEAGDVILMGQPLRPLPLLIRLSRETVRIIRQNILIFAFVVNGLGIVLTAWLWPLLLPADWYEQAPLAGVIYHQFGSLLVLLNSMRLLWFDRPRHPAVNRLRDAIGRADNWMERYLNLNEALHWFGHHAKKAGLIGGSLVVLAWLASGLTVVAADELAVVRRFGSPLSAPLEPGLHWVFPWPVDSVLRVQPDRVRIVEIGFRSPVGKPIPVGALGGDWASAHRGEGISRREEEAVMITGDGNLVELQATVRYTISRPHLYTFLFEVRDPDDTIRAAAESVLREAVAAQPFLDLLTINRERFQEEVLSRLRKRWESTEYGPAGLGIRLDGLSLHDLHPPQDPQRVVDAFHDVAKAMERRDLRVNQAEKTRIEMLSKALQEEMKTVREAEAAAEEKVRMAEANRDAFLARDRIRHELSWQDEWQLLSDTAAAMKAGQDSTAAYEEYQRRRQSRLAVQTYLTDFRLSLRSLTAALQKRDKVIVDADKLPGKRHLLLFDPELMRPAPIIIPTERQPPRSPFRPQDGP